MTNHFGELARRHDLATYVITRKASNLYSFQTSTVNNAVVKYSFVLCSSLEEFFGGTIVKECMVFHGFTLISAVMCARASCRGSTYTFLCVYLRVTPGHISVSDPSHTPAHS